MNTIKKLAATFIVAALLGQPLAALQNKGSEVLIKRKTGMPFQGELLAVKPNALVVSPTQETPGEIFSVDIGDIETVEIIKKSKVGVGMLFGTLIGGGLGLGISSAMPPPDPPKNWDNLGAAIGNFWGRALVKGFIIFSCTAVGFLLGTLVGVSAGANKRFHFATLDSAARDSALLKLSEFAALKGVR
jgi:hypothetical protein